jgi:DNA polymerase III subunit epsilon
VSLGLALGLIAAAVAVTAAVLVRVYVLALRRLAREASLIASANPGYRTDTWRLPPLRGLALAVNELAERSQAAQQDVEGQIAAAGAELEQERNRLAALMSELTFAVLVCNVEGQILLYNAAARELFGVGGAVSGVVGLGRSIFGILDRSLFAHGLERVRRAEADGGQGPRVRLTATAPGGRLVDVTVAPVRGTGGEIAGFLLTLEDVTRRAEAGAHRDVLLQSLTEGTRASVGAIRAAIESMIDYPDMEAGERQRFMAIIREEAVALGAGVEAALRKSATYLRSEERLAEMLGRDLLAALQQRLESDGGPVSAAGEDGQERGELWLRVDSYAVVQAATHLVARLRASVGVEQLTVELDAADRYARLDFAWSGPPLDPETLRAWTEEPVGGAGGGTASSVREVMELHGGEVWCEADAEGGRARVRLLLPLVESAPPPRPAPARPPEARPEFYDFDLFRAAERAEEWDERRLDELAYTLFDTETTGLNPSDGDEILSIGAVRIVNGRLLRQEIFDQLVDPGRAISPRSVSIHGITPGLLEGQPTINEALPLFARFCDGTVLVGHNVGFDMRFLELKETQTGVRLTQPVLDTLLLDAVAAPEEQDHSLEAMAARLGVSVVGRHTALGDAILTGEIFLKQLRLLAAQGFVTLGEAREAARSTYLARRSGSLYSRA